MDSIKPSILEYYQSNNIEIIKSSNQDTTDLQKAIDSTIGDVSVLGALSGRFDHVMNSIHLLKLYNYRRIFLYSNDSVAWLLSPNILHEIDLVGGPICGLIPIFGDARITTTGLKWNLDNSIVNSMGDLVSTSNEIVGSVSVISDQYILWTSTLEDQNAHRC